MKYVIKIKNLEIPMNILNYKTSKSIKMYFKEGVLTITKSPYVSKIQVDMLLKNNEQKIYEEYQKIMNLKRLKKGRWETGQTILYKGEEYVISNIYHQNNLLRIKIDKENKIFVILLPKNILKEEEEIYIKKAVRILFKENTEAILQEKLPYWSKITNIKYKSFKVRDCKSKYGSCTPKTKELHFSSRLVMMSEDKIDAIIVHELCHIIYPNHSQEFYNLVEKYIPNYSEVRRWLKKNGQLIAI